MIGDLVMGVMLWVRQFTCIHSYAGKATPFAVFVWRECSKCGRTRDWNKNL